MLLFCAIILFLFAIIYCAYMEWSSRLPPKGPYCKRCRRTLFEAAPQATIMQAFPKHAMSTSIVLVNAILIIDL